jgi:hypothetical protein
MHGVIFMAFCVVDPLLDGLFGVGAVNCDSEGDLCNKHNVKGKYLSLCLVYVCSLFAFCFAKTARLAQTRLTNLV